MLAWLNKRISGPGGFTKSVTLLAGGMATAQAIAVAALPLLTRIYSPADFSALAIYSAAVSILAGSACLRFEVAIPLPHEDNKAAAVLVLALASASIVSIALSCVLLALPATTPFITENNFFARYAWTLPVGVLTTCLYSALQYWAIRKKEFTLIAKTRLSQASGGVATQLLLGLAAFGPIGLILGQVINGGGGMFAIAARIWKEHASCFRSLTAAQLVTASREFGQFPKYSAAEALASNVGIQLPLILIATYAAGPEAGFLLLSMRVLQSPMTLIGAAVGQVYLSEAPAHKRAGNLGVFTAATIGGLLRVGVGPLLFVGIVGEPLFALVFGHAWARAGSILPWMIPWYVFQFLSAPVSICLQVTGHNRRALILHAMGAAVRTGTVGLVLAVNATIVVEAYAVAAAFFYIAFFLVVARTAGSTAEALLFHARKHASTVFAWVALGVIFRYWLQ